jgi:formate/nitrite transporter FocA (FNT family)
MVAIVLPVSAFVAAGFEDGVANMCFIPMGLLVQADASALPGTTTITWIGMVGNLVPVILGNLVGGSCFVAVVYHLIYRRGTRAKRDNA